MNKKPTNQSLPSAPRPVYHTEQAETSMPENVHTITRMEPQARHPDRYNIWLDGRFAFGMAGSLALAKNLSVGSMLSDAEIARLRVAEQEQTLFDAALRFLGARPRSRAEVRQRLLRAKPSHSRRATTHAPSRRQFMRQRTRQKNDVEHSADDELAGAEANSGNDLIETGEEIEGMGEADAREARLALIERVLDRLEQLGLVNDAAFASFWAEQRERFSPRAARAITQELRQHGVDRAIAAEASDPDRDEEQALLAARQRLRSLHTDDYTTFRTRLGSFLQRRGFGYEVAGRVIRQLWAETHESMPDDEW